MHFFDRLSAVQVCIQHRSDTIGHISRGDNGRSFPWLVNGVKAHGRKLPDTCLAVCGRISAHINLEAYTVLLSSSSPVEVVLCLWVLPAFLGDFLS